jgi:hypothetical protein
MKPPEAVTREIAREWLAKAGLDLLACDALVSAAALSAIVAFQPSRLPRRR